MISFNTMSLKGLACAAKSLSKYQWGAWSLVSLYISIGSGIVVALQYDLSSPFYSSTALDLLVPYGEFARSVHFYSSQFFFLFSCIHLIAIFEKTDEYTFYNWAILIISLPTAIFLLFTGYVLRGDSTGFSAGMIAEAILKNIPLVGESLNNLFFAISDRGMQRVYVHHVITLDVLWLILVWDHLRRYRIKVSNHIPLICLTFGFCLIIPAPIDPEKLGVTYISGPWFFLGLQELLRYFHPLFAGVIVPIALVFALVRMRKREKYFRIILYFIYTWLALYLILTTIAWLR